MDRRSFVVAAAALPFAAFAQAAKPRVAFVSVSTPKAYNHLLDELRAGLRALGYVEGKNLTLDVWWAHNDAARVEPMIAELLLTHPSLIVSHGSQGMIALQQATRSVPIVFASVGDPVGQGLIQSFRRPGGNLTGIAFNEAVNAKVYELTRIVLPGIPRVALFFNPDNPAARHHRRIMASASKTLRLDIVGVEVRNGGALEAGFEAAREAGARAVVVAAQSPFPGVNPPIAALQFRHGIPTFHATNEGLEAGGLASYSFPLEESFRRSAWYVDQILRGRSPADLPVEIPTRYEIAINMRTARVLGIKVPESALIRAHKVVD